MDKPWFMFDFTIRFGDSLSNVQLGGAHDLDIGAPPNYKVTALLPGRISSITDGTNGHVIWGKQVGIELAQPYKGKIRFMGYLHLSAVDPGLRVGQPISEGDTIGWVGGASSHAQYAATSNPTGHNFLNTPDQSSRTQVGVALMRGPEYGHGAGWVEFPPVDWDLDATQIILDARQRFLEGGDGMLQINDAFAAKHFTQMADDRWHCVTTNKDVIAGILNFYRRIGGAPRLPLTGEQRDPVHGVTYQVFESGVVVFDPDHKLDNPTGFDQSYLLKLDSDLAKKILQ
ncbi:MAG TPA: hypothetical protein VJ761_09710 [Ktedonobacteraceae bacterium]|nr:hypothetical protein [Ktedonobacteraceae bacterium]